MRVIVLGPQGSGKTTQAELLAKHLHVPLIDAGELIRHFGQGSSKEAHMVKKALLSGDLIDNHVAADLVKEAIEKKGKDGFVIDGYPRSLSQIHIFRPEVDKVVYISLSREACVERLILRKRADDTKASIHRRLEIYHRLTEHVLTHFREMKLLVEIDGNQAIEDVHSDILRELR